ncbi:MAG: ABC transporter substrate-binding protein [Patescibacteria group bacterium]
MKKVIVFGLVAVLLLGVFAGCVGRQSDLPTIKIGYRGHDAYLPLFVGMDKGLFEKNGFQVEPIKFESTNQLMEAMLAGRIDASLGGVNTILLYTLDNKSPGNFKIFSLVNETKEQPVSALVTKSDAAYLSVQDLQGKKIGTHQGSSIKLLYNVIADQNKLTAQLMQMDQNMILPSLTAGQLDAGILLEPYVTIGLQKKAIKVLEPAVFDKYLMTETPLEASVVSSKWLKEQPELFVALKEATDEAIDIINNNPKSTLVSLSKYTPIDSATAELLPISHYFKAEEIKPEELKKFGQKLLEIGELKKEVDINQWFIK